MSESDIKKVESIDDKDIIDGFNEAIEITRADMLDQEKSMILLRDIAKTFLSIGSTFITFFGGVNIVFGGKIQHNPILNISSYALLVIFYLLFVYFCIMAIKPDNWYPPFVQDYNELTKRLCVREKDRKAVILSSNIDSLDKNKDIVKKRSKYVTTSAILLGINVTIILAISVLQNISIK